MTTARSLWDQKMSVGIRQFDDHHKKLLGLIANLQESMAYAGRETMPVRDVLQELLSYSKYHFSAEQRLMKQYEYPRLDEHLKMHTYFIKKIQTFINKYNRNEKDINQEMLIFLKDWLITHILKIDKEYGILLRSHGME